MTSKKKQVLLQSIREDIRRARLVVESEMKSIENCPHPGFAMALARGVVSLLQCKEAEIDVLLLEYQENRLLNTEVKKEVVRWAIFLAVMLIFGFLRLS